MSETSRDTAVCGWRVRSAVPLPGLPVWTGEARAPDLHLKLQPLPAAVDQPMAATPFLRIYPDGACRLDVPAVASFLVRGRGSEILIEPHIDPAAPDLRTFLLGIVLALVANQRRLFPLHAACLRIGGQAVAIAGASRAGKSTLAAALARRGHEVLADNVCVIDPTALVVQPAAAELALWRDALDALGIAAGALPRCRAGQGKHHVTFAAKSSAESAPLRMIYLVSPLRGAEPEAIVSVPEDEAAAVLAAHVAAPLYRDSLDAADLRAAAGRIAAAVPVRRLAWRMRFEALDGLAQALEGDAAS